MYEKNDISRLSHCRLKTLPFVGRSEVSVQAPVEALAGPLVETCFSRYALFASRRPNLFFLIMLVYNI